MAEDYCTLADLKAELSINDTDDDLELETSIAAASRQIDAWCGRSFWQDADVTTRRVFACSHRFVDLLEQPGECREISTTSGLIVKIDDDADGVFETTLTITTDFDLLPLNASADGWGYSQILLAANYSFPLPSNGRPGVEITARFGWPAVPDAVKKACLVQASQLFKAKDAVFGAAALGESQAIFIRDSLNATSKALLKRYRKPAIG